MNNEGIKRFKAAAQVGEVISIGTIEQQQKYRYHGAILSINEHAVVIADELAGGTVTTTVAYKHFYWHSLEGMANNEN